MKVFTCFCFCTRLLYRCSTCRNQKLHSLLINIKTQVQLILLDTLIFLNTVYFPINSLALFLNIRFFGVNESWRSSLTYVCIYNTILAHNTHYNLSTKCTKIKRTHTVTIHIKQSKLTTIEVIRLVIVNNLSLLTKKEKDCWSKLKCQSYSWTLTRD